MLQCASQYDRNYTAVTEVLYRLCLMVSPLYRLCTDSDYYSMWASTHCILTPNLVVKKCHKNKPHDTLS